MLNIPLQWHHNGHDGVSNHQPPHCLPNHLFGCRSKKTSKLRVTGLCAGNSPGSGELSAQMASNAENNSIWWRHHVRSWARASKMWRRYLISSTNYTVDRSASMHNPYTNTLVILTEIHLMSSPSVVKEPHVFYVKQIFSFDGYVSWTYIYTLWRHTSVYVTSWVTTIIWHDVQYNITITS